VLVPQRALLQDELLAVQDLLRVAILHIDPERLCGTVVALIPHELLVGAHVKLNTHQGASDGLYVSLKLKPGQLVDLVENGLAHLGEVDHLTNLLRIHIVEVVPLELRFFLYLASDVLKVHHLCELAQGCH